MYVDLEGPAAQWVETNSLTPGVDQIRRRIADRPAARQVAAPIADVRNQVRDYVDAAAERDRQPVLVVDVFASVGCAGTGYPEWFEELAQGIGSRQALVVLRDGDCGDEELQTRAMSDGVARLRGNSPHALVFLDATRIADDPRRAATTLTTWSVRDVTGVAINIGGYQTTTETDRVGAALQAALKTATGRDDMYVLADSSRNGAAVTGDCNPTGARLGSYLVLSDDPTTVQYLWLTTPGTSDGACGIAPHSTRGQLVPEIATALLSTQP